MSKFVDKLHNLSKSLASPIGFHPSAREPKGSAMLLIAGLSGAEVKEAETVAGVNVDAALVLNQGFDTKIVKQMIKTLGDVPLGVLVKEISEEKVKELVDLGCDFVVFDIKVPVETLHKEGIGKSLMIVPSLDHGLVRAINSLDIDSVFLGCGDDSFITVEHLLIYQRFGELLDKPLIVILPSLVNSDVLSKLRDAGVGGVVTPTAQPSEAFIELRKVIDNLPQKAERRRASAILPRYGGGVPIGEGQEEEEEEEEEEMFSHPVCHPEQSEGAS